MSLQESGQVRCSVNEDMPRDLIAVPVVPENGTVETVEIRCADEKQPSGAQNPPDFFEQAGRRGHMFQHLLHDNAVKLGRAEKARP